MNSLNEMQEGIIKEIGNVGAGHIMMSLSQMTKVPTNMDVTRVYEFDSSTFHNITSRLEGKVCAAHFSLEPAPCGGFLLVLPKGTPDNLIITLRSSPAATFNNFAKSYSKSLEEYLGLKCTLKYLKWHEKEEPELFGEIFGNSFKDDTPIILIDTRYSAGSSGMSGHTFLYFDSGSHDDMIRTIDKKLQEMIA